MQLNLHEIIGVPGRELPFDYEPDFSDISFDSVTGFAVPPRAVGMVRNSAGVLVLTAVISADVACVCARCLTEFQRQIKLSTEAVLAEELQDENNTDIYLLDGDYIDLDEVVKTAFVLNMDQRFLCKEDCKGLCEKCGKNLNDGPCSCRVESDPRLAVLGQFLEKE